jgi:hypothetical protein
VIIGGRIVVEAVVRGVVADGARWADVEKIGGGV